MGDFPANGRWTIYSVQKTLPILGQVGAVFGAHNYLALVAPDGKIDCEMQGVYTGKDFVVNGPVPGNHLNVWMYHRDSYIPDQSVLSFKPIFVGEEEDLRDLLHTGYREVAEALDATHMLYDGAEIFGHAVNSNSVWYTALRAMGVEDPSQFDGWGSTPGNNIDLREEPSNNEWFGTSRDQWVPNPSFESRFPEARDLPPTVEVLPQESEPSDPAFNELDAAIEEEQQQLRQQLQEIEAILGTLDEDAFPADRDVIEGFLDALNAQLDGLAALNGSDLLDRLSDLVDRLNEWRDYLQGQARVYEEERAESEEQPLDSFQEEQPEPEPDYAWVEPDPQLDGDERD